MSKRNYYNEDGVWRTIGGRRVFIRNGQSLSDAMKESGKFKNKKKDDKNYRKANDEFVRNNLDKLNPDSAEYEKSLNNYLTKNGELGGKQGNFLTYNTDEQTFYKAKQAHDEMYLKNTNSSSKLIGIGKQQYDLDKRVSELTNGKYNNADEFVDDVVNGKYKKADKEWQELSKKMEKDYDEFGTTRWEDEKRLNELSRERDTYQSKVYGSDVRKSDAEMKKTFGENFKYDEERTNKVEVPGYSNYEYDKKTGEVRIKDYNEEEAITRANAMRNKLAENRGEKSGNDYLPKESKILTAGTSNRKEVSDNIQAHILDHYDNPVDFMEQMDAMDWLPTRWHAGQELAKGGQYLIYNGDIVDYLNSLNINPKGKSFSIDKSFDVYTSLIGRESAKLYDKMQKLYEQYKKEHAGSDISLEAFRKWFK